MGWNPHHHLLEPSPRQISVFHRPGSARTAGTSSRQHETLSHGASDALCGGWAAEAAEAARDTLKNHGKSIGTWKMLWFNYEKWWFMDLMERLNGVSYDLDRYNCTGGMSPISPPPSCDYSMIWIVWVVMQRGSKRIVTNWANWQSILFNLMVAHRITKPATG